MQARIGFAPLSFPPAAAGCVTLLAGLEPSTLNPKPQGMNINYFLSDRTKRDAPVVKHSHVRRSFVPPAYFYQLAENL